MGRPLDVRRLGRRPREPRPARPHRLVETPGPDPVTPLSEVRLAVGVIVGMHGVQGELKLRLTTDDPDHLRTVKRVYVGDEPMTRRLIALRWTGDQALIRLDGIRTREQGVALRGKVVRISGRDARPLLPGEYYLYQVIGLEAFDEGGGPVGTVTDIMETGANDVLVIAPAGGGPDVLLPNHPDVVIEIRPEEGRMTVRPLVYDG